MSDKISTVEELEGRLSEPISALIEAFREIDGDLLLLGVAGKMGPTLARMARRAADAADAAAGRRRIIGVSRFSDEREMARLRGAGIEAIRCDLLDEAELARLPDAPNVVYLAGMKFGSTESLARTWAVNTLLPGLVARRFTKSRIAALSTGNVYGLTSVNCGGSIESDPLNPTGEYAQSCVGRERILEHFSRTLGTRMAIVRLNYACDLRYGVLVDLAEKIRDGLTVDLSMGYFNVIWQADASAMCLGALRHASSPPFVVNVAGPEILSVKTTCDEIGRLMDRPVTFRGAASDDALLSDGSLGRRLFGPPRVDAERLVQWVADWVDRGGATLGKPTHFEARDGRF